MKTAVKQNNILVVYYSKTGMTKKMANLIAELVPCDLEAIVPKNEPEGWMGYAKSLFEVFVGAAPDIEITKKDPSQYQTVIIGTPVWARYMASPMRTYLIRNAGKFKRTAFLVTYGSYGNKEVFRQLERMCERHPVAKISIKDNEIKDGSYLLKVRGFVSKIRALNEAGRTSKAELHREMENAESAMASR